jgi:RNA polymerase sigma-70 factor, ECF subfamily
LPAAAIGIAQWARRLFWRPPAPVRTPALLGGASPLPVHSARLAARTRRAIVEQRIISHDITRLLRRWQDGDVGAREQLMTLVYDRVVAIAAQSLQRQSGATLTPTELAHEALIRLLGTESSWIDRRHFFHVVAQATRQLLVDRARKRLSEKRGSGAALLPLSHAEGIGRADRDEDLLRVDQALGELGSTDPRQARVVEMTYFGGFSREEIAAAIDSSVSTVDRDLRFARAWLKDALSA